MDKQTFVTGYGQLSLAYSPKRDLPAEQHDLLDETWWKHVQLWHGPVWLAAVDWWIGHKPWMPKVSELREAYDALLIDHDWEAELQAQRERLRLEAPEKRYVSLEEYGRERFAKEVEAGAAMMRERLARIRAYRKANGLPSSVGVPEHVWKDEA